MIYFPGYRSTRYIHQGYQTIDAIIQVTIAGIFDKGE